MNQGFAELNESEELEERQSRTTFKSQDIHHELWMFKVSWIIIIINIINYYYYIENAIRKHDDPPFLEYKSYILGIFYV